VENALLNLAINARDAMSGHGKLTIEAGNASLDETYALRHAEVVPGQYVMVAITDTGAGMPPEVLERAFEPFFTTKREGQGTGLGLSMVYGFVKQSGGHVKVYSEEGHGTTVRIYLPRAKQEEDIETDIDAGPAKGGSETILVVEDDEEVRATVVAMLGDLGYRVLRAKDAQSALAIVESGVPIDLLFTDVVMPGPLRSTELARKARERVPGIAVLFTSGYTDNAIVHAGRLDEGIDLLSKPYTHEAMARKVRHVLGLHPRIDAPAAVTVDAPPAPQPDAVDAMARMRVLFVEDNELVRASSAELLRTFGLDLTEAASVDEALTQLREQRFEVLLTDVDLAGESGVRLAMNACRDASHLGVVFVTGYDLTLSDDERRALPRAIQLRKPYDPLALINALNAAVLR
jgi:CheY-like chemotaxis protein